MLLLTYVYMAGYVYLYASVGLLVCKYCMCRLMHVCVCECIAYMAMKFKHSLPYFNSYQGHTWTTEVII